MKPFIVYTTAGLIPLMARNRAHAIASAIELGGPGCQVISCLADGDW